MPKVWWKVDSRTASWLPSKRSCKQDGVTNVDSHYRLLGYTGTGHCSKGIIEI